MNDYTACELCSAAFPRRTGKRFCSEQCRKRAESRRLNQSKPKTGRRPRQRISYGVCRDCGTTEDMYWWQSKPGYSKAGGKYPVSSAATRCRPCYSAYYRHLDHLRNPHRASPLLGPPKPPNYVPPRYCSTCDAPFRGPGGRCAECAHQHRKSLRPGARARRLEAEHRGDRDIHWLKLGERDGWRCHLCSKKVAPVAGTAERMDGATVDHLIPIASGGTHTWGNVALAHRSCNLSRGTRGEVQLRLVG